MSFPLFFILKALHRRGFQSSAENAENLACRFPWFTIGRLPALYQERILMEASLYCLECIATQALRAARLATSDELQQRAILDACMGATPGMDLHQSPAVLSLIVYETAKELTGVEDPYRDLKVQQNEMALALEDELRALVLESDTPLDAALSLAAAGNIIDLGTMRVEDIDVREAVRQVMQDGFAIDHTEAFKNSLAQCNDLLFLLDNAGEIVFDKILIEELQKHTSVTAVVKGAPIINDAVMADAEQVGLTALCEVIDNGGAFVGSPVDLTPPAFRARMEKADMILGKGQGNYETVDVFPGDVFLILRAKCEVIARHMGVKMGQVGLISTRQRGAKSNKDAT
jgi:damage-control phosphatase, subfamily I